jgi:uncharacterized protein YkwD
MGRSFNHAGESDFAVIWHLRRVTYPRTIFFVFAATFALLVLNESWTRPVQASADVPRYQETLSKEAIITLTNSARASEGLTILEENPLLDAIAEARARDILDKQYFGHLSPTGDAASHVAEKVGYRYRLIAENLASGVFHTNSKIVECWMLSPGHRKNILSPRVREMGASVIKGRLHGAETWVSVQIFGLRSDRAPGRPSMFAGKGSAVEVAEDSTGDDDSGERLRRMKRALDAERNLIRADLRSPVTDVRRNEDLNTRICTYNKKADQYNYALVEEKGVKLAMSTLDQ